MTQEELLINLNQIFQQGKTLFRVKGDELFIDSDSFSFIQRRKIEKILNQYGACKWRAKNSNISSKKGKYHIILKK